MGRTQSTLQFKKEINLTDVSIPIYWDAFNDYYKKIWRGIPEIGNNDLSVRDMCYYNMLSSFYFESDESYTDRRLVLYHYMKTSGFNWKDLESLLNRKFDILPVNSEVKTNLRQLCTAYDEPPLRTFSTSTGTDKVYKDVYNDGCVDSLMQDIYELAKLTNVVAVAPSFKFNRSGEPELKLRFIAPNEFRVQVNPGNPWEVQKLVYPDWNIKENEPMYHIWTDEEYYIKDYSGDMAIEVMSSFGNPDGVNPYGVIPWVLLKLRKGASLIDGGRLADVMNNLRTNKALFGSEVISDYGSFPIPFGVNLASKGDTINISPDKMMGGKANVTTDDVAPDFKYVDAGNRYNSLLEYHDNLSIIERNKLGIPEDDPNESGIARIISRQQLIEERRRDLPALTKFESDLADMIRTIGLADGAITDKSELNFGIEYADERIFLDPDIEREQDRSKVDEGLMSIQEYYTKWGNFDKLITQSKLKTTVENRIKEKNEIDDIVGQKEQIEEEEDGIPISDAGDSIVDELNDGLDTIGGAE